MKFTINDLKALLTFCQLAQKNVSNFSLCMPESLSSEEQWMDFDTFLSYIYYYFKQNSLDFESPESLKVLITFFESKGIQQQIIISWYQKMGILYQIELLLNDLGMDFSQKIDYVFRDSIWYMYYLKETEQIKKISISKDIYPAIGKIYQMKPANVEQNIRTIISNIEAEIGQNQSDVMNFLYPNGITYRTNSDFIFQFILYLNQLKSQKDSNNRISSSNNDYEHLVDQLLFDLNVPIFYKGAKFLKSGILYACEILEKKPNAKLSVMKDIYPMIGDIYQTKPANVERNIRTIISNIEDRIGQNQSDVMNFLYPNGITYRTNSDFISQFILYLNQLKSQKDSNNRVSSSNNDYEHLVDQLLFDLNVPMHYKGAKFLKSGILYVCEILEKKPNAKLSVMKDIYPMIGDIYQTKPANVERNIRTIISNIEDRIGQNQSDVMNFLYPNGITYRTNSDFISQFILYLNQLKNQKDSNNRVSSSNNDYEHLVDQLLFDLNVPMHYKGAKFLKSGILYACEILEKKPNAKLSVMNDIYPTIGNIYQTKPANVEHNIRTIISNVEDRIGQNQSDVMNFLYPNGITYRTNSDFISRFVFYLRQMKKQENSSNESFSSHDSYENLVDQLLFDLNVPLHYKGANYLKEGILYILRKYQDDPFAIILMKEIYIVIVKKFNTTLACIDQDIQTVIYAIINNISHNQTDIGEYFQRYPSYYYSNQVFIFEFVDYIQKLLKDATFAYSSTTKNKMLCLSPSHQK